MALGTAGAKKMPTPASLRVAGRTAASGAQSGRSPKADVGCPMNGDEVTLLIIAFADHSDRAGHCSRTR
jgi:hypothetical protein